MTLYYARMSASLIGGHPAILCIPSNVVVDPQPDKRGWGPADIVTRHLISAEAIEVLTSDGLEALEASELRPQGCMT
jgi:hypothetical protein